MEGLLAGLVGGAGDADGPSAAAKDSCPARKQKHLVSSPQEHGPQVAVAQAHLALFCHRAGMQNACNPMPMASAALSAAAAPFFIAMAAPRV